MLKKMLKWLSPEYMVRFRAWMLVFAEVFDAWRVMPRVLVMSYGWMVFQVVLWFEKLPAPTTQQTTFVSIVTGITTAIFGFYVGTGRKWDAAPTYITSALPGSTAQDRKAILQQVDKLTAASKELLNEETEKKEAESEKTPPNLRDLT